MTSISEQDANLLHLFANDSQVTLERLLCTAELEAVFNRHLCVDYYSVPS